MKPKFTIGADPELFFCNTEGKLISVIGLLGGSKDAPKFITKDGHAILEDNVAAEFNIPPSDNASDFVHHLNYVLSHLSDRAKDLGLQFAVNKASASFPADQLQTPEAFVFGCEPDFNAWTLEVNPKPHSDDAALRSCGGHVHVGTDLNKIQVVRAMDLFLGVPSVLLDDDVRRRDLYGKPGAFRSKPYGVEYRTLSNFWIWKDDTKRWVFEQTEKALAFVESGQEISEELGNIIRSTINTGDTDAAKHLGKTYSFAV